MPLPQLHYRRLSDGAWVEYHDQTLLPISGGTVSGPLTVTGLLTASAGASMGGARVTSVATPSAGTDAVNKTYCDASGVKRIVSAVSTATTAAAASNTDYIYVCTAALTLTLPTAVGNKNQYTIKRTGTGTVTVATTASQTIDGAATFVVGSQWQAVVVYSDGANWIVVSEYMTRTVNGTLTATTFVEA